MSGNLLDLPAAIATCTVNPARILTVPAGTLTPGVAADVCVFDPQETWVVGEDTLQSAGKNTPLLGKQVQGRVRMTLLGGQLVHRATIPSKRPPRRIRRS